MTHKWLIIPAVALSLSTVAQEKMNPELLWKLNRVSGETVSPDGKSVILGITHYNLEENKGNRNLFSIPSTGGTPKQLTNMAGSEYDAQYRPDGKKIGFLNGGQIWEMNPDGTGITQLSDIEGGVSHFKYAPNGQHIAYTREVKLGKTIADMYPDLKQADVKVYDNLMYRHWDHWNDDMYSHVFIADLANNELTNHRDIMKGELFETPTQPFGGGEDFIWSPDSKQVVYVCKKQAGMAYAISTNTDLYAYSLASKKTENLTKGNKGYDTQPSFSADGKVLAWTSMKRDGYESDKNDIKVRNILTGAVTNITSDWDNTVSSFHWGEDGKSIYFQAAINATYQLFEVNLKTKKGKFEIRQITEGEHNIGGILGQTGKTLIASKSDMNHASELYSYSIDKGNETKLTTVNDQVYKNVAKSKVEKRLIKAFDGKDILTWVIYPPDFDPTKKYPTLLYCQGGPQSAVSQFYSFRWNFQLMAAQGYIVVAPNRRGLPSFGTEWNETISQDWGGGPMKDYLAAIDALAKEPYVDENNLGAVGASYGGYSVYMLAGIHENRFKSFISHCGLFNLESWYGSTEELFFANFDIGGPYWFDPQPKSYKLFSPHKFADKWNTPIMVIHGGKDFRVPDTQGLEAFQVAQLKGLKSRLLYFPNEGHWVLKPQNGLVWHGEFFKWLDETLKKK